MRSKSAQRPRGSEQPPKERPFYEQVADALRAGIIDGEQDRPVRLPPELELCEIHKVSRITIRRAMDILVREGLVERTPKRGTITVPGKIAQWKQLCGRRVIHVLTGPDPVFSPSSFYGRVYSAICERCQQAGYQVSGRRISAPHAGTAMDLQPLDKETTLGVIFLGFANEVMVSYYTDAGHTVVCADYWTTNPLADAVVIDCFSEGQTATEFFLRHGHTNLFFVGHTYNRCDSYEQDSDSELLLAGMQRTLVRAGRATIPAEKIRFFGGADIDGRTAAEWFLSLSPRPTAGIVFNHVLCGSFIEQLRVRGVYCPKDISLICKAEKVDPIDITCLRGSGKALGEMTVDALLDRASGRRSLAIKSVIPSSLERGRTVRQLG